MYQHTTTALAALLMLAACGKEPAKVDKPAPANVSNTAKAPAADRALTLTYFNMQG